MTKLAIIGAGIAGLTLANQLKNYVDVTIFEKAKGAGGRVATRRAGDFSFDHGAQFFKARSDNFKRFIKPMLENGIIKIWRGRFVEFEGSTISTRRSWDKSNPHYVATPSMNHLAKHLSQDLNIFSNRRVSFLKQNDVWVVIDDQGNSLGNFDWVVLTAPAEQSAELLPKSFAHYNYVASTKMLACFSLMLGFDEELPIDFDAALVRKADISWISVNSSKPDRSDKLCLLVHSTNKWADAHLEDSEQEVLEHLCRETSKVMGLDVSTAAHRSVHSWRYANIGKRTGPAHLLDFKNRLAVCGDWLIQGRVESAFTSALGLAMALKKALYEELVRCKKISII